MVVIEEMQIDEIPVIHVILQERKSERLPLIVFWHGFKSVREKNLHYAFLLAKKGYRVVLPSVIYHGERQRGLSDSEMDFRFWDIVLNSIAELEKIKDYFEKQDMIDTERIGIAGTSMGGLITLGALTKYPWIKAAVSLMGMPAFSKFFELQISGLKKQGITLPIKEEELKFLEEKITSVDLSKQPEKLSGRPLLFWHGKQDRIVPFSLAYEAYYEQIKPLYKENPEKLEFIVDDQAEHKVSWDAVLSLVEWFEKYV